MYFRCQEAEANCVHEPRGLYNLIQFLMSDADKGGTIDREEVRAPDRCACIKALV